MRLPRDSFGQYDVVETWVASPPIGTQILQADPDRIAVLFGSTLTNWVSTLPTPPPGATDRWGLQISGALCPLTLSHAEYGPVVSMAWYATRNLAGDIAIISVYLRRQPPELLPPLVGRYIDIGW